MANIACEGNEIVLKLSAGANLGGASRRPRPALGVEERRRRRRADPPNPGTEAAQLQAVHLWFECSPVRWVDGDAGAAEVDEGDECVW
jgi:hypothetical protein